MKEFGNADYVRPTELNAWILGCDNLASLDPKVANAIIAMIAARAICGGDADLLFSFLINRVEGQRGSKATN